MLSLTIFKSQFDNKTHRSMHFESWSSFVNILYGLSKKKGEKGGSNSSPLISPASYLENTTRANRNVTSWGGWAAVDVDDYEVEGDLQNDLVDRFGRYNFVCYSTASSRVDKPKFRLVFEIGEKLERPLIPKFWYALNAELGEIGDKQTKDLSRMYYVPAQYPSAHNFIFDNSGDSLSVDALIAKHPYVEKTGNTFLDRLPPELQKAVVEHRKGSLDNTNFVWSGYSDCPFFPKHMIAEYRALTGTGWYHKMYQIMVAIAGNAVKRGYPITAQEIENLCREFDKETGNWYENRPMRVEADRALEYIYRNG